MYEFRNEPARNHIMRHAAWERHQAMLARCRAFEAQTGQTPIYGLSTALALLGLDTPPVRRLDTKRLHLVFPSPTETRIVRGTKSHSWKPLSAPHAVIDIAGVRCTSPAATFVHMASHCSLADNVVIADAMMCRDRTLRRAEPTDFEPILNAAEGCVGVRDAQWALGLARPDTDSPAESRMRLQGLRRGLPNAEPNIIIGDDPAQRCFIDMAWPEYSVGMEYHGAHHAEQVQHDVLRSNLILASRWQVFQAFAQTLADEASAANFFRQVAAALRRAGAKISFHWKPLPLEEVAGIKPRPGRHGVPVTSIKRPKRTTTL